MRIRVGARTLTATVARNATARDFVSLLPPLESSTVARAGPPTARPALPHATSAESLDRLPQQPAQFLDRLRLAVVLRQGPNIPAVATSQLEHLTLLQHHDHSLDMVSGE